MNRVKWIFHCDAVVNIAAQYDTVRCSWEVVDGIITIDAMQWLPVCVNIGSQIAVLIHHSPQPTACQADRNKSGHRDMIRTA